MIISKTPYRLSLFGGGTDYPAWFENNPSTIVSAAMAKYCWITLKELQPFFEYRNRIVYSRIESTQSIAEINHPSARACLQFMNMEDGISISHDGDLPARSGIGSSSSFTVGLLHALYEMKGYRPDAKKLATTAITVEQNFIGENVGIQDQIMASYGGIQLINMGPGNEWKCGELKLDKDYQDMLESHIMLGFSGVSRYAEELSKKQVENIKRGDNYHYLKEMMQLTDEAIRSLWKQDDMSVIGKHLQEGWSIKRQLYDGISDLWIDAIYKEAINAGAFGGKLMGAGGGGFFFFIVPPEKQKEFKDKMYSIKVWVPFKFDTDGSQIVRTL